MERLEQPDLCNRGGCRERQNCYLFRFNDKLIETEPSVVCGLYLGSLLAYTIIILLALLHWFNGGEIGGEYEPFLIILGIGAFALDFRMRKTFKISE